MKKLAIAALPLALTGCFLELTVDEGGLVESSLGTCAAYTTCSYQVTDATFDVAFEAIPRGGYVFSHWRGGDGYQCPGSENPVCQVSNTAFAGNAGAEGVIAGDGVFKIEPVFRLTSETAVIVDATGAIVGRPYESASHYDKILVNVNGAAHTLGVDLTTEAFMNDTNDSSERVYFTEQYCQGDGYMEPSNRVVRALGVTPNGLFAPNFDVPVRVWTSSDSRGGVCNNGSSYYGPFVTATKVDLDVVFPLHADFR